MESLLKMLSWLLAKKDKIEKDTRTMGGTDGQIAETRRDFFFGENILLTFL